MKLPKREEPKLGDYMEVNGEKIARSEVMELVRSFLNQAKNRAGEFYEQDRSEKFRANWPNIDVYVNVNWGRYIDAARTDYAKLIGDDKTPEYDKRRAFLALCLYDQIMKAPEKDGGLQIMPNTQQFVGDKHENYKIKEQYGRHSNTFNELLMPRSRFN
jgi:hypothetical protein